MTAGSTRIASDLHCRLRLRHGGFELRADFDIGCAGITGVFGPSGSGKTSLLRAIAGLEPGARGELRAGDACWQDDERGVRKPPHARALGMVFQQPRLFGHLNVRENLDYALRRRVRSGVPMDEVVQMLALAPLLERRPQRLSGGERQRVALGRAALCAPRVLLLDEPLSALDAARRSQIIPFVQALQRRLGVPALYVSHSLDELVRLADSLLLIEDGRVGACGPLTQVLASMPSPLLRGESAGVALATRVVSYDPAYDLTEVRADRMSLQLPGEAGERGASLRVHILARDVGLSAQAPRESSLLNFCPVRVENVIEPVSGREVDARAGVGPFVIVRCRAGQDVVLARITRRSCELLQVAAGRELYAQIKSAAVRTG